MMPKFVRVALLVLCAAGLLIFLEVVNIARIDPLVNAISNYGHVPLFGSFAALIFLALKEIGRPRKAAARYFVAGAVAAGFGLLSEAAQIPGHRDASALDFLRDSAGTIAFLAFLTTLDKHIEWYWRGRAALKRYTVRFAAVALAALPALPILLAIGGAIDQKRRFPLITGFETVFQMQGVSATGAVLQRISPPPSFGAGTRAALVTYLPVPGYPRFDIAEPHADWTGYERFCFDVYSELAEPFRLSMRIHDAGHTNDYRDRFTGRFMVNPGATVVCFDLDSVRNAPAGRRMDLSAIEHVSIFTASPAGTLHAAFDNMRLE